MLLTRRAEVLRLPINTNFLTLDKYLEVQLFSPESQYWEKAVKPILQQNYKQLKNNILNRTVLIIPYKSSLFLYHLVKKGKVWIKYFLVAQIWLQFTQFLHVSSNQNCIIPFIKFSFRCQEKKKINKNSAFSCLPTLIVTKIKYECYI